MGLSAEASISDGLLDPPQGSKKGSDCTIVLSQGRAMRVLLGMFFGLAATIAGAHAAPSIQAGRELAIDACSACHQVTPDQKPRPPVFNPDEYAAVAAPTFGSIAAKYARRPSALRRFILNPVHPMPEQNWDPDDLTAVVAFIESLQPASPTRQGKP